MNVPEKCNKVPGTFLDPGTLLSCGKFYLLQLLTVCAMQRAIPAQPEPASHALLRRWFERNSRTSSPRRRMAPAFARTRSRLPLPRTLHR